MCFARSLEVGGRREHRIFKPGGGGKRTMRCSHRKCGSVHCAENACVEREKKRTGPVSKKKGG